MPFAEDLTTFFQATEHAVVAELDGLPVVGIFNQPHAEAYNGIATSRPEFTLPSAAAERVTLNSELRIGDLRFQVRSVEPDGTGVTRLTLQESL